MNLLTFALLFGLAGPACVVALAAHYWRGALPHRAWFLGLGGTGAYLLMAACMVSALSDIGITGVVTGAPASFFDAATLHYAMFLLAWLAGTAVILLSVRYALSKLGK